MYLTAHAHAGSGDQDAGREMMEKAAQFNGLNVNYAFVRNKAMAALED